MIITTLEELRLFSPSNAVDNIDSLTGFINSSEQDFLRDKLGNDLYGSLAAYYNETIRNDVGSYIETIQRGVVLPAYATLLYLCQKAVTYDALSRAVSIQAISINGMGINVAATDNYKAADRESIAEFRKGCVKEAHSAINSLLQTLEDWAMAVAPDEKEEVDKPSESDNEPDLQNFKAEIPIEVDVPVESEDSTGATDENSLEEKKEIVTLWKKSRYFYLVTTLLIPSAIVLQRYYNIYESREKYIQMVPDLRYVQEDIIAPIFGDEFIEYLANLPWTLGHIPDRHTNFIIHNLRKITARYLEMRLIKTSDDRHNEARNEAVKLTNRLVEYLHIHQQDMNENLLAAFKTSPLYEVPREPDIGKLDKNSLYQNNSRDSVMFVTPGLI